MSKSKTQQQKLVTFVDHVGRTIIGEILEDSTTNLKVKNPAIIHVQPMQSGQLNVQTIPLYFREFVSEQNKKEGTVWSFNKSSVAVGENIENDSRLVEQYTRLFSNDPTAQNPGQVAQGNEAKVIKLFDE